MNDKNFLELKIRYGMLLGFLHGFLYAEKLNPDIKETTAFLDAFKIVEEQLGEILAETFNKGEWDNGPTIEQIINDTDFLQELFPVAEE